MNQIICYSDLLLLSKDPVQNVESLIELGADCVELMMDGPWWNEMEHVFDELASKLRALAVQFTIHPPAWDINITSENQAIRNTSMDQYVKAIQFAHMIEAKHVVIHPGFCFSPVFDKVKAQARAKSFITELCQVAKPLGVKLGIENVGYAGSSLFNQTEYSTFLDDIDETAGYLVDTGHAHLNQWDIPRLLKDIQERLLAVHIHDNYGGGDDHLPLGEGSIKWEGIFEQLRSKQTCHFILEYAPGTNLNELKKGKKQLENMLGFSQ